MLPDIKYIKASTLKDAYQAIGEFGGNGMILAGGTDLLIELRKQDLFTEQKIVDISGIDMLKEIRDEGDYLSIGSLVTHTQLLESTLLKKWAGFLSEAASQVGCVQIRNRGTIGGNICNASPSADTIAPLVALDAEVVLESEKDSRTMPLTGFIQGPYKTVRKGDELLTWIKFKKLPEGCKSKFIKLGRRNALSIARLQVATAGMVDNNGKICYIRLAPGSAMPSPTRIFEVEEMLMGQKPSDGLFKKAGEKTAGIMVEHTGVRWSTEYKKPVLEALVARGLMNVFSSAKK